jgi:hypothetical protein
MVDNASQTGNDTIRTKDRAGVETQIVGLDVAIGSGTEALMSPANPMPVNLASSSSNVTNAAGSLTGSGTSVSLAIGSQGNGTIYLGLTGSTNVPMAFEGSVDGTNFFPIDVARSDGQHVLPGFGTFSTGIFAYNYLASGYATVRVRQTAAAGTQGTVAVILTGGPFLVDYSPTVPPVDGTRSTYMAGVQGFSSTFAGDMFRLTGSATRTIRIIRFEVTLTTGGATNTRFGITKRTGFTAGTAGTTPTIGAIDSTSGAATAASSTATAAGTAGTTVAILGSAPGFTSAAGTVGYQWTFGNRPGQAVVLRGTGEHFVFNNSSAPGTSGSWNIVVEFTEE